MGGQAEQLRLVITVGLTFTAAAAAAWVLYGRRSKRQTRDKKRGASGRGASLADEIRGALGEEAEEFELAKAYVSSDAASGLSDKSKLLLYGWFKQATVGDCTGKKPWGIESGMKWEAWNEHRGCSTVAAMTGYVQALTGVAPRWRAGVEAPEESDDTGGVKGMSMAPCVSTMGVINDREGDVDSSEVGRLCASIADGQVNDVRKALTTRPGMAFKKDKDGMTPLHWAADRGEHEVVKVLLDIAKKLPDKLELLNIGDDNGDTALHYAVMTEQWEIAKLIAAEGADAHVRNEDNETAFSLAKAQGRHKMFSSP